VTRHIASAALLFGLFASSSAFAGERTVTLAVQNSIAPPARTPSKPAFEAVPGGGKRRCCRSKTRPPSDLRRRKADVKALTLQDQCRLSSAQGLMPMERALAHRNRRHRRHARGRLLRDARFLPSFRESLGPALLTRAGNVAIQPFSSVLASVGLWFYRAAGRLNPVVTPSLPNKAPDMSDCCAPKDGSRYDLAVIGAGSAGFSAAIRRGTRRTGRVIATARSVAPASYRMLPSKTLIRAAETLHYRVLPRVSPASRRSACRETARRRSAER